MAGIVRLLVGDPLVSGSLKVLFYEYVQYEDKDIPGREKVVGMKVYWGIMAAPNPSPKWKDMKVKFSY